jgi:preprotein translocase subunit SecD
LILENAKLNNDKRTYEAACEPRRSERLKPINRNLTQDFILMEIKKKKSKQPSVHFSYRQNKAKQIEKWSSEVEKQGIQEKEVQEHEDQEEQEVQEAHEVQELNIQEQLIQEQEVQEPHEVQELNIQEQLIQELEVQELHEIQERNIQEQLIQEQEVQDLGKYFCVKQQCF